MVCECCPSCGAQVSVEMVTTASSPSSLAQLSIFISLSALVVLVPVVLYKIHIATNKLVE